MRVLVDIGHPAHVHLFKNLIWNLEGDGCEVKITTRDKDSSLRLLDAYGFKYDLLGKTSKGLMKKAFNMLKVDYELYKLAKRFKPDVLISHGSPYAAHVSALLRKTHISFTDSEHVGLGAWVTFPFTDVICTPSCFKKNLGSKHVKFNGYYELAYLHPLYFKPNPAILDELGISANDKFFVLRFVSWSASHDIGQKGLDINIKRRFVKELEAHGRVFITSEGKLDVNLERYKLNISPEKIHDLLYYAEMYVGEGATMATESGILGTPSVYISSLVGTMGNFEELESKYGLVYSFRDSNKALEKTLELFGKNDLKSEWQKKREKLLDEKIDVTAFMTHFIENYPESFYEHRRISKQKI